MRLVLLYLARSQEDQSTFAAVANQPPVILKIMKCVTIKKNKQNHPKTTKQPTSLSLQKNVKEKKPRISMKNFSIIL